MGTIARGTKAGGGVNLNSGQTADPAEVNTDENTVYTEINGLLDDANIETATIPGAKSLRFTEITAPSAPGSNDVLLYAKDDNGVSRLYAHDASGNLTDLVRPRSYLAGFGLANNAGDATNDIDVAAGMCEDSTHAAWMVGSALTKQLDAAWAVGTNAGFLDTGSIANTTYHVFAIKRVDTGVVDYLASTSATAPTMPTSYTLFRRIGSIVRASAAIKLFIQDGDTFMWLVLVADIGATNPGTAAVTRTLTLPTGIRVKALMGVVLQTATVAAMPGACYISDLSLTDSAASRGGAVSLDLYSDATLPSLAHAGAPVQCFTNTSAQVRSRVETSGASTTLYINTAGWIDTRGRDA